MPNITDMSFEDLLALKNRVDERVNALQMEKRSEALAKARDIVNSYGLTLEEVFAAQRARRGDSLVVGKKVAPKYRNPETGVTWTGRGKTPLWLVGKDREQFLIAA